MINFLGPDAAEGVAALREKRPPEFPVDLDTDLGALTWNSRRRPT